MTNSHTNTSNFTRLKFIVFFSAAVFLCVVIFSSFWRTPTAVTPQEIKNDPGPDVYEMQQLLMTHELLYSKWMQLERVYATHTLLNDSSETGNSNKAIILFEESSFDKTLDSLADISSNIVGADKIDSIITSYKTALKNRQSFNNTRHSPGNKISNDGANKKEITDLQNELQVKSTLVVKLQNQLKSQPVQPVKVASTSTNENKKMKDELEFLKWALRSEVSSNHALTNSNNQLKQANAALMNQVKEK